MNLMKTKERLAEVLEREGLKEMAEKARQGYYDDYESMLATPITQLVIDLTLAGKKELAGRAKNGEFDCTLEESREWFNKIGRHLRRK